MQDLERVRQRMAALGDRTFLLGSVNLLEVPDEEADAPRKERTLRKRFVQWLGFERDVHSYLEEERFLLRRIADNEKTVEAGPLHSGVAIITFTTVTIGFVNDIYI